MTSTFTRRIFSIFGFAIALSVTVPAAASEDRVAKSKGNGAYIEVSGTDASGCVWVYLNVSRGGTTAAPQTWMYYDVYNQCQAQWIAYGGGSIANTTFKVSRKGATVVITPVDSAAFVVEGVSGPIQLTLTADGVSSYSYSGHSRSEYAGHVYQSHGSWTSQSATVTGSFLGFALGNMRGSFGEGRDKFMEIERGSKR